MSRARANLAARTTVEKLRAAAIDAHENISLADEAVEKCGVFDAVLDFCQPRTEEVGGKAGGDAWYAWQAGEWAVLGDLGMLLHRDEDALARVSAAISGEIVVAAIDNAFEYAQFSVYKDGKLKRRLTLEDGEIDIEGLPVPAERGRHLDDFTEEDANRLWTSYGLATFEFDPQGGPFECVELRRES